MAMDLGGCCRSVSSVKPANSGICPRQRASSRVDRTGLKRAPCANATMSAVVALPMAALADADGCG